MFYLEARLGADNLIHKRLAGVEIVFQTWSAQVSFSVLGYSLLIFTLKLWGIYQPCFVLHFLLPIIVSLLRAPLNFPVSFG